MTDFAPPQNPHSFPPIPLPVAFLCTVRYIVAKPQSPDNVMRKTKTVMKQTQFITGRLTLATSCTNYLYPRDTASCQLGLFFAKSSQFGQTRAPAPHKSGRYFFDTNEPILAQCTSHSTHCHAKLCRVEYVTHKTASFGFDPAAI